MLPRQILRPALFALALVAAAPAHAADPAFPTASRIGMVAPAGFTPSSRFAGFENPFASALITLAELPADAYADVEKGFSNDESLKSRGWTIKVREPLTFKDGKGFFIAGPQESQGQQRYEAVMVANTGGITSLVSVQMVEESAAAITDAVLRDMFKTVTVRPTVPESERLAVLPYKIGNLAKFRLVKSAHQGVALLTDGPKDEVTAVEQPFLLIANCAGRHAKAGGAGRFRQARVLRRTGHQGRQDHARRAATHRTGAGLRDRCRSQGCEFGHRSDHRAVAALRTERVACRCSRSSRRLRGTTCSRGCARSATASSRASTRHARPCAGHPRLTFVATKTWMAGTSPAMTKRNPTYRYCRSRRLPPEPLSARPSTRRPALGAARVRRWCSRAA